MENKFQDIRNNIADIKEQNYKIHSIEEFCYLAGQIARYLVNQSEAKLKTFRLLDGVYNANNIETLKSKISILFDKYNHAIRLSNMKFGIAYKEFLEYNNDNNNIKEHKDFLYAGTLGDNFFYEKNENKGDDTNEK